jgi:hypothetical protein
MFQLSLVLVKGLLLLLFLLLLKSQKAMLSLQCCRCRPYPVDVQSAYVSGVPSIVSLPAVVFRAVSCILTVVNTPLPPVFVAMLLLYRSSFCC